MQVLPGDNGPDQGQALAAADSWRPCGGNGHKALRPLSREAAHHRQPQKGAERACDRTTVKSRLHFLASANASQPKVAMRLFGQNWAILCI